MAQVSLYTLPAGHKFAYGGIEWMVLNQQDDRVICLSSDIIGKCAYDVNNSNHWPSSSLRGYLNEDYFYQLIHNGAEPTAFIKITSDLTTDDGLNDYGICEDNISLLTCEQYRQYRKYLLPGERFWLITASSIRLPYFVCATDIDGALYYDCANYDGHGIRPVCALLPSLRVFTKGLDIKPFSQDRIGKAAFVRYVLSPLLVQANTGWARAEYQATEHSETIRLEDEYGIGTKDIDITANSLHAIVLDVFTRI